MSASSEPPVWPVSDTVSLGGGQASALSLRPSRSCRSAAHHRHGNSPRHRKIPLPPNSRSNQGHVRFLSAPFAESPTRRRRTRTRQTSAGKTSPVVPGQNRHPVRRLRTRKAWQETLAAGTLAGLLFRASRHRGPERIALRRGVGARVLLCYHRPRFLVMDRRRQPEGKQLPRVLPPPCPPPFPPYSRPPH